MQFATSEVLSLKGEILRRGKLLRFTARGQSMFPSIRDGDILTVRPVHPSELRVGEIAFYSISSKGVAHRLISASRRRGRPVFLFQGDRSLRTDPPIPGDEILGRVVEVSRNGRRILLETLKNRLLGVLWALTSPLRPFLYPILRRAIRVIAYQAKLLPTERLLILLSKTELEERERNEIVRHVGEVDWEKLLEKAIVHGVAPTAYLHLRRLKGVVPEGILARSRRIYLSNLRHNLRLRSELQHITSLLNSIGVESIPLKGVFLAEWLHGDPGLRPSSDLDLLVRREDLPLVRRELRRLGYELSSSYPESFANEFLRHQAFVRVGSASSPVCLEIHWSFFPKLFTAFDLSRVWRNSTVKKMGNSKILTLSPEDTLLYLAISLKLHGYIGLKLFSDLCQLLKVTGKIDWDYVIDEAGQNHQRVGLYYALKFTRDLFGAEIPGRIISKLSPNPVRRGLIFPILNQRRILKPVGPRLRRAYWDVVRLVTIDHPPDILRTFLRAFFLHPREVFVRHGIV